MKRIAFSVVLLVSAFACSGSPDVEGRPSALAAPIVRKPELLDAAVEPAETIELTEDRSDAADDLVHTVPTGSFPDVGSFCAAQVKLVAAKVAEANDAYRADGWGEMNLQPSCEETPKVLEGTNLALAAPFAEAKAVTFETGYSTESYLLVRGIGETKGWTAVRAALLYANHNDPGCGSIERPGEIVEVHVQSGALVVKTTADRIWFSKKEELGELSMTYVRACRPTSEGIACGTPEVVDAKVVLREDDTSDAPLATRFFSTTYAVGPGVAIETATHFDENDL